MKLNFIEIFKNPVFLASLVILTGFAMNNYYNSGSEYEVIVEVPEERSNVLPAVEKEIKENPKDFDFIQKRDREENNSESVEEDGGNI